MNKVYQVITDRVLELLERGVVPWRRPWSVAGGANVPVNITGRRYRGINLFLLAAVAMAEGYESNVWLTFNQVRQREGKVKAGSKGVPVVFWKWVEVEDPDEPDKKKEVPFLRYYTVFNLDQTENVKVPRKLRPTDLPNVEHDPLDGAEAVIAGMPNRPRIAERTSDRAFYSPALDAITVPLRKQFAKVEEFYATLFHELGHSTGHRSRLNRPGIEEFGHFGDQNYSREELVAEMTAAFLGAVVGIDPVTIENHAAYVNSWRKHLLDDPKAVITAAGQAQRAADYILGLNVEVKAA